MSCSSIHHVEMCLGNVMRTLHLFTHGMAFSLIATRSTVSCEQWVLRHQNSTLVLTQRRANQVGTDYKNENNDNHNDCTSKSNFSSSIIQPNGECDIINDIQAMNKINNILTQTNWNTNCCINDQQRTAVSTTEDWTVFCCSTQTHHSIDSVFNTALIVRDVHEITDRVHKRGGTVIKQPTVLSDHDGEITYSIVATGMGNMVHTLIDRRKYFGTFLPGFTLVNSEDSVSNEDCLKSVRPCNDDLGAPIITHIDHVAYVCEEGKSQDMIQWYEEVFSMKRFLVNRDEDLDDGLTIEENVGLRLKALEYWKCFEMGLYSPRSDPDTSLKIVIAEPITTVKDSHVSTFLSCHGGPGIQHIALHSPAMLQTVQAMAAAGVPFRKPPPTYYQQGGKLEEMLSIGLGAQAAQLQAAGVLLDTEPGPPAMEMENKQDQAPQARYLMQIFSEPIFGSKTFFLEVVHRAGAEGFGVGNITALARSIAMHQHEPLALPRQ